MIDGITIKYNIPDFDGWRRSLKLPLTTQVETDTGEIRTKRRGNIIVTTHRGKWETFDLIIKEVLNDVTGDQKHYLTIKGSLHKNYYEGENFLPFTWENLQSEIKDVEKSLKLTGELAELVNLEIGINITVPFAVFPFLQRDLISYKGHPFNRYDTDKNGVCLGCVCSLSQYSVKIYDKGTQYNLSENVMRIELRFLKMQSLNKRGINTLTDLKDFDKINGLLGLLLDRWDNVLLFDTSINLDNPDLKTKDREILLNGSNPKFWEQLKENDIRRFNYQRAKYRELVALHGKGWHTTIKNLIITGWDELFKKCTILPTVQKKELNEFTIKIKGKIVQNRFCLSCGNPLHPEQSLKSKFCSANFVGEAAAHKCRNMNSNPRNNFKNKIKRINGKGVLFDITPYFKQGKVNGL